MRILPIDIETRPNLAYVWGLWDQNINLKLLQESVNVMCFAAKWLGEPRSMQFHSIQGGGDAHEKMIRAAFDLLDEADAVMHYNGKDFDEKHLNTQFLLYGLGTPSPYKHIDLLSTVRKRFKFPSTKLEYVSKALGLEGKVQHSGFELWLRCMLEDDPKAWKEMEKYNRQDVVLLEQMYPKFLPWIANHPNRALYDSVQGGCRKCAGLDLERRGFAYTGAVKYQQYRCRTCGTWTRDSKRIAVSDYSDVPL